MLKTEYVREALKVLIELAESSVVEFDIRLEAAKTILAYAIDVREKDNE